MSNYNRCAACELFGRRCSEDCIFAPYFPSTDPERFESLNRIYGAANVARMLQETPAHLRGDLVEALLFEARARIRDPVYGCMAIVFRLQQQVLANQWAIALTRAWIAFYRAQEALLEAQIQDEDVEGSSSSDHERESFHLDEPSPDFNHPPADSEVDKSDD